MKALFSFSAEVPFSRVVAEHRRWLSPVGILLAINIVVLLAVVLPLRRSVQSGATRADASAPALRAAQADLADAEATRDGQARAAADLDRFYAEVLPTDFTTARRITHIKLSQLARSHDVAFQSSGATPETLQGSALERLHVSYALAGEWDDIRRLIYDIETGPDFVVIDNLQLAEARGNEPLSLTLELSTYYKLPGAPSASGATSATSALVARSTNGR